MLSKRIQKSIQGKDQLNNQNQYYVVSVMHQDAKVYTIDMSLDHNTVQQTMRLAIAKLNNTYKLNLNQDLEHYQLYGARKNGKRKQDLPALSKYQIINKIGMKRFALEPTKLNSKNNSCGQLMTLRSIQTTFTDKRLTKQLRLRDLNRQKSGCFCFY